MLPTGFFIDAVLSHLVPDKPALTAPQYRISLTLLELLIYLPTGNLIQFKRGPAGYPLAGNVLPVMAVYIW